MVDVRRAERGDVPGIKAVLAATWRDTYSHFMSETVIAHVSKEWHSPRVLEAEVVRPSTYIGVATSTAHEVVGMISAHVQGDVLSVARLYVLPEFQRQGIGERLMNEACRAFPHARRLRLDVEEQNPKGRSFYRKLGFTEMETRAANVAGAVFNVVVMERPSHGAV